MTIQSLWEFPVKSLAGNAVSSLHLHPLGATNDRRWMLVDDTGRFISQREHPRLCRIRAQVAGNDLVLTHLDNGQQLAIPDARAEHGALLSVTVWDDTFTARLVPGAAASDLSDLMGMACRLVYMAADSHRPLDPEYALANERVSFADGFPYLITNQASLDALSEHYGAEVAMLRFRPNIVVAGAAAFAEDNWKTLHIGKSTFRLPKTCSRCIMVTVNPQTAEQQPAVLQRLADLRTVNCKIQFGMNACWLGDGPGTIAVGDTVRTGILRRVVSNPKVFGGKRTI